MGRPRLLLMPLKEDLLCAFSASGITSLPKPQTEQPGQKKHRMSSSSRVRSRPGSQPKAVGIFTPKQRPSFEAMRRASTPQQAKPHRGAQLRVPCYTLPPLKPERSPALNLQKRRFQPSSYPVITDFFVRGHHEKKKRPRKHGIVPPEKLRRLKHASGMVGASGNTHYHCTLVSFLKTI